LCGRLRGSLEVAVVVVLTALYFAVAPWLFQRTQVRR
jgi:hypothetical protein